LSQWIVTAAVVLAAAGCQFTGSGRYLGRDGVFFQQYATDCGAAALTMIFQHFGIDMDYGRLQSRLRIGPGGADMLSIQKSAREEGLLCEGWRLVPADLPEIPLPAILLLRRHFVVLAELRPETGALILDPSRGRLRMSLTELTSKWKGESLLFCKPGAAASRQGRWFAHSQSINRRNTP
jgi:ABC-type bacteriocin/lantibiotic exporter with double-glycine peptidase domain